MKDLSKQVVILDNIPSEYIHQAIIILKSYPPGQHEKIIAEAEKIVSSYFDRRLPDKKSELNKSNRLLKGTIIILSAALAVCSYIAFFR